MASWYDDTTQMYRGSHKQRNLASGEDELPAGPKKLGRCTRNPSAQVCAFASRDGPWLTKHASKCLNSEEIEKADIEKAGL